MTSTKMDISSKKMLSWFFPTSQSLMLCRAINVRRVPSQRKEAAIKCSWIVCKPKRKFSTCLKKFSAPKSGCPSISSRISTAIRAQKCFCRWWSCCNRVFHAARISIATSATTRSISIRTLKTKINLRQKLKLEWLPLRVSCPNSNLSIRWTWLDKARPWTSIPTHRRSCSSLQLEKRLSPKSPQIKMNKKGRIHLTKYRSQILSPTSCLWLTKSNALKKSSSSSRMEIKWLTLPMPWDFQTHWKRTLVWFCPQIHLVLRSKWWCLQHLT